MQSANQKNPDMPEQFSLCLVYSTFPQNTTALHLDLHN